MSKTIQPDYLDKLPITALNGVGASMAKTFEKLGIATVQDLLFHLPFRYLDRTRITPISQLQLGQSAVIVGRVASASVMMGKRRSLAVKLDDGSGQITLRFYHFNAAQKNSLTVNTPVKCFGEPRIGAHGMEMYHPEYKANPEDDHATEETLTPIYPLSEGISQQRLRKFTLLAIEKMADIPPVELLPSTVNQRFGVANLAQALQFLHFPPPTEDVQAIVDGVHPYQQRLAFEEMLAHFLVLQYRRLKQKKHRAATIHIANDQIEQLLSTLPFKPTNAQNRVLADVHLDYAKASPMLRMVQGDVGSGKTLVAAMASLSALKSGYQVALVAPTEILSEQHYHQFETWLSPLGYKVLWLVGKLTPKQRQAAHSAISDGSAQMIVGTHALFQDSVQFAKLGLAVIDEQHRFGVAQRLTLRQQTPEGETPHQLIMTATPIPRTLAMTAYADLDYSVIDELPPGRTPINTVLSSQNKRDHVIQRVGHACREGKQAYWVCPLVEESEALSVADAEATYQTIREALPDVSVGLIHGRMKASEKQTVMADFKAAKIAVLVATTVIEVGVDVPNASLMIIENPERLGLAQLHQLRGRVGRGQQASHCLLLYGDKLSQVAQARLQVLRETTDGFVIAQKDLEIRGPGELMGTRQTGDMQYRMADPIRDDHLIQDVHTLGRQLLTHEPSIASAIIQRWFHLSTSYADV